MDLSSYEKKSKKTYYSLDYLTQITLFQAAAITSILKKNAGAGTNQKLISNCSWAEGLFKILVYENAKDKNFLFTEGYGGDLSNFVSSLFNRFDKEILEFFKLLLCNGVLVDDLKKKVFEIRLLNFNKFKSIINNPRVVGEIFKDSLKIRTGREPAASEHFYFLLFLLAILRKKKKKHPLFLRFKKILFIWLKKYFFLFKWTILLIFHKQKKVMSKIKKKAVALKKKKLFV